MHRSGDPIDLGAVRRNARRLLDALDGSALWAVVKANGYGHGAVDFVRAPGAKGERALRRLGRGGRRGELRHEFPTARILVLGPADGRDVAVARDAGLELCVSTDEIPGAFACT